MLPATPQRTAERRRVEPTPMIEVGDVRRRHGHGEDGRRHTMTLEATVCAAKPPVGVSWMIRRPIVRMMRKPPA